MGRRQSIYQSCRPQRRGQRITSSHHARQARVGRTRLSTDSRLATQAGTSRYRASANVPHRQTRPLPIAHSPLPKSSARKTRSTRRTPMRSPIKWYGGKGNMTDRLLPLFPPHHCYVEVFGGGASMLFAKPKSKVEVYNDLNSDVVNFFRIFHDRAGLKQLRRKLFYTPWSRELYKEFQKNWHLQEDRVERIYRWFVVQRMSFSAVLGRPAPRLNSTTAIVAAHVLDGYAIILTCLWTGCGMSRLKTNRGKSY